MQKIAKSIKKWQKVKKRKLKKTNSLRSSMFRAPKSARIAKIPKSHQKKEKIFGKIFKGGMLKLIKAKSSKKEANVVKKTE